MTTAILKSALLAASALALAAIAPAAQAGSLSAGNYSIAGIQNICLLSNGTWYGETFASWGGGWKVGPTKDDATILWGTYSSGFGVDSMIATTTSVDWTEFHNDRSFVNFIDSTVTRIHAKCSPPAAGVSPRKNPMD